MEPGRVTELDAQALVIVKIEPALRSPGPFFEDAEGLLEAWRLEQSIQFPLLIWIQGLIQGPVREASQSLQQVLLSSRLRLES